MGGASAALKLPSRQHSFGEGRGWERKPRHTLHEQVCALSTQAIPQLGLQYPCFMEGVRARQRCLVLGGVLLGCGW